MPFQDIIKKFKALQDTHDAQQSLKDAGLVNNDSSTEVNQNVLPPQMQPMSNNDQFVNLLQRLKSQK